MNVMHSCLQCVLWVLYSPFPISSLEISTVYLWCYRCVLFVPMFLKFLCYSRVHLLCDSSVFTAIEEDLFAGSLFRMKWDCFFRRSSASGSYLFCSQCTYEFRCCILRPRYNTSYICVLVSVFAFSICNSNLGLFLWRTTIRSVFLSVMISPFF